MSGDEMPMKRRVLEAAGLDTDLINKMMRRGNIGIGYFSDHQFKCFCRSDKGRVCRYICGNTLTIGFFEGYVCDGCKTYFKAGIR